jgi:lipid-binding SYLF domain-containing protein
MKRVIVLTLLAMTMLEAKKADTEKRLRDAAVVLEDVMKVSDKSIPQELMDKAECVVVMPGLKKGGFIIAAQFGRGFLTCRAGNAGWTAPGSVKMEGGSLGFQAGGAEVDVILLVMNRKGAERLMTSQFTLGGEAEVAAGPVGRSSSAQTDATMRAEILSYSRARGVFGGVALKGSTLRQDEDSNEDLYGKTTKNVDIVKAGVPAPAAAKDLLAVLNRYSSRK